MNISNQLTALAADITSALQRDATNRAHWIQIKLDLCRLLAAARAEFLDDAKFGKWLDQHEIGISKDDRAAYIAMGADLEIARQVLEITNSRSIRLIYRDAQDRFRSAEKPPRHKNKGPAHPKKTPATDTAFEFIAAARKSGAELPGKKQLAKDLGVSHMAVEKAIDRLDQNPEAGELPPADTVLSKTAQEKLDAYKRQQDRDFEYRVQIEARRLNMEFVNDALKRWEERIIKFEKQLAHRSGVMKAAEYKIVMMCCHPDTGPNVSDDRRNEATRILTEHRLKLMDEKQDPMLDKHGLPRTADDLRAARERVRAANSARSKAAHARRKAQQQEQST
jgi:DNA-binding transcriptional regulator YhcF (GntR family)